MIDGTIFRVEVSCGSCRACCKHTLIVLHDGDPLDKLDYEIRAIGEHQLPVLKHRADGACIHLDDEQGCLVHAHAPLICRTFDCRGQFARFTRNERREMIRSGLLDAEVLAAGRARLREELKGSDNG